MPNILDEIRAANVNILNIAKQIAPNGKAVGNEYITICPFHSEKTPSFKINIRTGLTHCFGCGHKGDIVSDFAQLNHITLGEAKRKMLNIAPKGKKPQENSNINEAQQLKKAQTIWSKAVKENSMLERYLRSRGLKRRIYESLRFYSGIEAELYGNGKPIPVMAMVANMSDAQGNFKSLHITELIEKNGKIERGEKRFFKGLKVIGNFVTFGDIKNANAVAITEGIETALSVKEALPNLCVLAALSASFMPSITLPTNINTIYIFIDNDNAGRRAGKQLEQRLKSENKKVFIIAPKEDGKDFNDVLKEQGIPGIIEAFNAKKETKKTPKFSILKGFVPRTITNAIKENYRIFVDAKKILWLFDEATGIWRTDADDYIEAILRNDILSDELSKKYVIGEIIADIKGALFQGAMFPETPLNLLPFSNGVYDIKSDTLLPFDSNYHLTYKLPIPYNPNALTPEKFLKFLNEIYEEPEELLELIGYTLYRSYPYQKIFFLYGTGGNGKSTYLNILSALLSKQNISSVSLKKIIENRFMASQLHQKSANISADEPSFRITTSNDIKSLTGGDIITAERKNQNPFQFRNYAKLIVSTNHLPPTTDKTLSFYRRVHLIKFLHKFEGSNEKRDLALKIINDTQEMEGIAQLAIKYLKKLYDKNFNFKNYQNSEKIADEYERLSNPVETFIETFTTFTSYPEEFITKKELKQALNIYLEQNQLQPMSYREIGKTMTELGFKEKFVKQNGKTQRVWAGIKWIGEVLNKLLKEKGNIYLFSPKREIDASEFLDEPEPSEVPF